MHIQIGEIKYPNKKATPLAELNYHILNSTNGVFDSYQLKTPVRMQPKLLSKYSASRKHEEQNIRNTMQLIPDQ